jgi:hypothetical protein
MVLIATAHISYDGPGRRDITLKSNPTHILSPNNWKMVNQGRNAKPGSDTWKKYVQWYKGLLWERYKADPQPFLDILEADYVVLCCYCTTPETCHRRLAVEALEWMADQHDIEMVYVGEINKELPALNPALIGR